MKTVIVVPARLQSERFPRKLLHPIKGKPLIQWTAERIKSQVSEFDLYFAVGEKELSDYLQGLGYQTLLTDPSLPSGTDRIAVANESIGADRIINVQADEPLVAREHILSLAKSLEDGADLSTLATEFDSDEDFKDPNKVKVVLNNDSQALYFSRAAIPYNRTQKGVLSKGNSFWHLGLYAYTKEFLESFQKWSPTPLEQLEKLEQLRALEMGAKIGVSITDKRTIGIDTLEDVEVFEQFLDI